MAISGRILKQTLITITDSNYNKYLYKKARLHGTLEFGFFYTHVDAERFALLDSYNFLNTQQIYFG